MTRPEVNIVMEQSDPPTGGGIDRSLEAQIRQRMDEGYYDSPKVLTELARRILASGHL